MSELRIGSFRLLREDNLQRSTVVIFILTSLLYYTGAGLRLVHELSLFWPLNGVMAGVFSRYIWLNQLRYYAVSFVAMLMCDITTTQWIWESLLINFSNMIFIITIAQLVKRDKQLRKNKYELVSTLRLFCYCVIAASLCAITGAMSSVGFNQQTFWLSYADWFSEQFTTGVLIIPCILTLGIPLKSIQFKLGKIIPILALAVSVLASVVIGGAGSLAFPLPALIWCAVRYTPQTTCVLTFLVGTTEIILVANSIIDIDVGSPLPVPQMFSARLGIATMSICPMMVAASVSAFNSLMKQLSLRAHFDFLTQVYSRYGLYEVLSKYPTPTLQPVTVMLLDIDYFKRINDNYGHECGDKILTIFAQHVQSIVGDKGLVARMGGEEFVIVLHSLNPEEGVQLAEKIRKAVELHSFSCKHKLINLTVSIGLVHRACGSNTLTALFNKLLIEADECLYRSKREGRNRTSSSTRETVIKIV